MQRRAELLPDWPRVNIAVHLHMLACSSDHSTTFCHTRLVLGPASKSDYGVTKRIVW